MNDKEEMLLVIGSTNLNTPRLIAAGARNSN